MEQSNTKQTDTQSDFETAQITQTEETAKEAKDEIQVTTMKDLEDIEAMWAVQDKFRLMSWGLR